MKTLIVYHSHHHGNTEKIARAMAEELKADLADSTSKDLTVDGYDLVGLGSGIYAGGYHRSLGSFINNLDQLGHKRFFAFSTSGTGNFDHRKTADKIIAKGGRFIGSFSCRGYDTFGPFKLVGGLNKGHPDQKDIESAKQFAKSMKPKQLTLSFIIEGDRILLGMKKRGFGEGRWNGFGGKVEQGETIEEAARREFLEESGIMPEKMEKLGVIDFDYLDTNKLLEVNIFRVVNYSGKETETEEMRPQWFSIKEIPFGEMWPDDQLWLPIFLKSEKFSGSFIFADNNKIISYRLTKDE